MRSISARDGLTKFRQQWSGAAMLDLLREQGGRMLVDWSVGVGKSWNIDQVIEESIRSGRYGLVIVLAPTRRILNERTWLRSPPPDVRVVNLQPRPATACGALAGLWQTYEQNNLGSLGRQELCGTCGNRSDCAWPDQYGMALAGTQVVFATQAHLERSPVFLLMLSHWCDTHPALVILDEANFVMKPVQRIIGRVELQQLHEVIQRFGGQNPPNWVVKWTRFLDVLLQACSADLESGNWHPPILPFDRVSDLQAIGRNRWGDRYRFIGYELQLLGHSRAASRAFDAQGNLRFAVQPQIPGDFLIYSGSTDHALTQHRLGEAMANPFADYRFFHPETRWYNIASRLGAKTYFYRNAEQILDFFSQLIATRLSEGKRVLLVAKKQFLPLCQRGIEARLHDLGYTEARVLIATDAVPVGWRDHPQGIPLIHFGVIGINQFESFDCCYCLTGFYIEAETLHQSLQDLYREDLRVALKVGMEGQPLRRYARVEDPRHRYSDINHLAQSALDHLEMGCVVQAVGRVRPYTKPREIITFQCAARPEDGYDQEFLSLGEARAFFGIPTRRQSLAAQNQIQVQDCRTEGLTQKETAVATGLSLRTVKRHWQASEGVTKPIKDFIRVGDTLPGGAT